MDRDLRARLLAFLTFEHAFRFWESGLCYPLKLEYLFPYRTYPLLFMNTFSRFSLTCSLAGLASANVFAVDRIPALSPEESMKTIEVPDGFHLELVASEPMVQEPASFVFDGNGAMYVCEWSTDTSFRSRSEISSGRSPSGHC